MSDTFKLSRSAQKSLGLPDGLQAWRMAPFSGGMNQQDARTALADTEAYWAENLLLVGKARYRALYDCSDPLFTAPSGKIILSFFPFIQDHTPHHLVFYTDGTADDVNQADGSVVTVSNVPGTFYDSSVHFPQGGGPIQPACCQWGNRALLIANNHKPDAYWAWDGTSLFGPGSAVSVVNIRSGGSGYTSAPTVTAVGGTGSGLTATAVVENGAVVEIDITNPGSGYSPTDHIELLFSGGGGVDSPTFTVNLIGGVVSSINVVDGSSGFTTTPLLNLLGGDGSGATATAVLGSGSNSSTINSVNVTNGGSGYSVPPTVQVQAGINTSAYADVGIMPTGVSGNSIEVFDSRVWLTYPYEVNLETGSIINVSAADSFTDFAQSDGGVFYTGRDRYLRSMYRLLRQSNGYLYVFGDSSVSIISNVQESSTSTSTSTTFSYQSTDPQIGIGWRDTGQDFSRTIVFANSTGVYGLYGGAVRRVSAKMNELFNSLVLPPDPGAITPSAAVANLHTIRCYLINMTIIDPVTLLFRTLLLGWDESEWFVASQSIDFTYIATQEVDSMLQAWGTDGTTLRQLFAKTSSTLKKTLMTKYFGGESDFIIKQPRAIFLRCQDRSGQINVQFSIDWQPQGIAPQNNPPAGIYEETPLPQTILPNAGLAQLIQPDTAAELTTYPVWGAVAPDMAGTAIGVTVTSINPDFELASLTIAYQEIAAIGM